MGKCLNLYFQRFVYFSFRQEMCIFLYLHRGSIAPLHQYIWHYMHQLQACYSNQISHPLEPTSQNKKKWFMFPLNTEKWAKIKAFPGGLYGTPPPPKKIGYQSEYAALQWYCLFFHWEVSIYPTMIKLSCVWFDSLRMIKYFRKTALCPLSAEEIIWPSKLHTNTTPFNDKHWLMKGSPMLKIWHKASMKFGIRCKQTV